MKENDNNRLSRFGGTAAAVLSAFLLFYLPSMLAILNRGTEPWGWTIMSMVMATLYAAMFCLNYFWLVPAMLIRSDRKLSYFLINFLLVIVLCSIMPAWFEIVHHGIPMPKHMRHQEPSVWLWIMGYIRFIIRDGVMMILSAGMAYAMRLSSQRESVRRQQLELDAERRQIEIQSLKAQLNPHFLFNSLNNIYALIGFAPDRAQTALHDLSSMLRFMIYDSSSPTVPLEKEMQFIKEYTDLMRLRLGSNVQLSCSFQEPSTPDLQIAPLLFLTLVENAFKHSGPSAAGNFIRISIQEEDDRLTCRVVNTVPENAAREMTESGVGLANVEKQLNLLYPGHHVFTTDSRDGVYAAVIGISLKRLA